MNELKKIVTTNDLPLLSLPKMFEIRWTSFSHILVNNSLLSWNALMLYFGRAEFPMKKGHLRFLSNVENLKTTTFIVDLLQIYSRHHKKTQNNNLTVISLVHSIEAIDIGLNSRKCTCYKEHLWELPMKFWRNQRV